MRHDAVVAIPARLESQRLPGKPLLLCDGHTLLWHTWQAALRWAGRDRVAIVTDSQAVQQDMARCGANVVYRAEGHHCGSRRVLAAIDALPPADTIIDLQCDEPEIQPRDFDRLCEALWRDSPGCAPLAASLACKFGHDGERDNPAVVKVVASRSGRALHFTRARIPGALRHVGVYAFRRYGVPKILRCEYSALAQTENLEQLDWLTNDVSVAVGVIDHRPMSINTQSDLAYYAAKVKGARRNGADEAGG